MAWRKRIRYIWGWRKIWKIFRVLSEMRGRFWYIDPPKSKFWVEIGWKCRNRLCQNLNFRFVKNLVSGKWENRTSQFRKNAKSAPQNLKFDFDFEFWCRKIDFQNLKIVFINSSRISFRDPKIRIQRRRKPPNLDFRFKIVIFASNFSSTKILILY